jgi:hypothetical protein
MAHGTAKEIRRRPVPTTTAPATSTSSHALQHRQKQLATLDPAADLAVPGKPRLWWFGGGCAAQAARCAPGVWRHQCRG